MTRKVIGSIITILILTLAVCTFTTNTYAADASYVLGITNVREARKWKTRSSIWYWWIKIR